MIMLLQSLLPNVRLFSLVFFKSSLPVIPAVTSLSRFFSHSLLSSTMSQKGQNGFHIDYDRFLNSVSRRRIMSALRTMWAIQNDAGPSMIALGTGAPNPACFPFKSIDIRTQTGRELLLEGDELSVALSYTNSNGYKPLIDWLLQFQKRLHDPPYCRHQSDLNEMIIIPGSEDGQCKILEMVLEPGDSVLIGEPAYPGVLSAVKPLGVKLLPVEMDGNGFRPDSLQKWLNQYQVNGTERRPKLLIIQPDHCNPTGVCTSLERKKEIYRLACEHDLLIIEDDPYYFLTFGDSMPPPSLLSMDTQGRVLRLESYSKVLSSGMRLGTLSGPRQLVSRVTMHLACSSLHASTLSQCIFYKYLTDIGLDAFMAHLKSVGKFYETRCKMMLNAAKKHLTGLAEWNEPSGGMFVWFKVPGVKDTEKMIMKKGPQKMVMLAPGSFFAIDDTEPSSYLRASFSAASEEQMNEGLKRLAEMIREEIKG